MSAGGRALLAWYAAHRRDLPWRRGVTAYRTWVAETMLQQTRVDTVVPRYEAFLDRFPTLEALAGAPLEEVLGAWAGLGYYARARNLHEAAVQARAEGGLPTSEEGWRRLPGVGPYMAAAVAAIAFGEDTVALDGNLRRVLSRYGAVDHPQGSPAADRQLRALALALLPPGEGSAFNQALMDLGALVCMPRRPACGGCPLAAGCQGRASGRPEAWPPPRRRRPVPEDARVAALCTGVGGMLLARRPGTGLLGGLWGPPDVAPRPGESDGDAAERAAGEGAGVRVRAVGSLGDVVHRFTHRAWRVRAWRVMPEDGAPDPARARWVDPTGEVPPLSRLATRLLALLPPGSPSLPGSEACGTREPHRREGA